MSLDADSVSQTDVSVSPNALQSRSFKIGAIINSSNTNPLTGVFGWEFAIIYNASAFIPQGDPGSTSYPDGATNTALFGAQSTSGTINWAGLIAAGRAFGSFSVCRGFLDECPFGKVYVFYTLFNPEPSVSISAKTLLANVNFELITKPSTPQLFRITDVQFVDSSAKLISGPTEGLPAVATITNYPPVARFVVSPAPSLGPFAFRFDASSSFDHDDSIPGPSGFFWDFGDGTQDLGATGSIVTHDYGLNGTFVATLRVHDSLGATGATRDSLGRIIFDDQPSHVRQVTGSRPARPPIASFSFNPINPAEGQDVFFDASSSNAPDGLIVGWLWSFGDGLHSSSFAPSLTQHFYRSPGNYTVSLTVYDDRGISANTTMVVPVHARPLHDLAMTFVSADPNEREAVSFQHIIIYLVVTNRGTSDETANITVYYGSNIIGMVNQFIPAASVPCNDCSNSLSLSMEWNTTGVVPGNYTISATVFLPSDQEPSDNTASDGIVQILPFPESTITVYPSRGYPSTSITVRGSGFPRITPFYDEETRNVKIIFDGQVVGFARALADGKFSFTFVIPLSHPGPHLIEAQDVISRAHASAVLHVLPQQPIYHSRNRT